MVNVWDLSRASLVSLLLVAGCAGADADDETPDETQQQEQRGGRTNGNGNGGNATTTSGDGSIGCMSIKNGFGATNITNTCGRAVVFALCTDTVVGTPSGFVNDCLLMKPIELAPGQILGLTRGHATNVPDIRPFYTSCFAPSTPVATLGDLRKGYRCP